MKLLSLLPLLLSSACVDAPPETEPIASTRGDDLCWNITIYPDCAVSICPLGVSDEPLRTVACTDKGDSTLCFCRQPEGASPLCGLHSQVWVYHC